MRGTRSNEAQPNYHRRGLSCYLLQIASPYPLNLVRFPRGRTSSIITGNPYLLGIDRIQIPRSGFLRRCQEMARKLFLFLSFSLDDLQHQKRDLSSTSRFSFFFTKLKKLNSHYEQETRSLFFNPFFVQRGFYIRIYINISIYNNIIIDIKNLDILLTVLL